MNVIIFDIDETLGAFSEFSMYCTRILNQPINKDRPLNYNTFRYLLDINPIFLQPNILKVLEFIKTKLNFKRGSAFVINIHIKT